MTTHHETSEQPRTRRRGADLERAILDAAWEQLVSEGYGRFTIDAVAARAGTSKPVLYRRWSNREELFTAAIRHYGTTSAPPAPDSGSLRDDVLAALRWSNTRDNHVATLLGAMMSNHFDEIGMTPAQLRSVLIGGRRNSVEQAVDRAVERGDIDPSRLTPRIIGLPFALFRNEYFMTLEPVPDEVLQEIVDDIFIPLVQPDTPHQTSAESTDTEPS